MGKSFEYDGRTYTFERLGSEVRIWRDDNTQGFDVYRTYTTMPDSSLTAPGMTEYRRTYHAYTPAFSNVSECIAAICGELPTTYYSRLIFAASAAEAAKIAEEEDHAKVS